MPTDPNFDKATDFLTNNDETLFTTDYVVDETLTLLRARGEQKRALMIGEKFFEGELAITYRLSKEDLQPAWETFRGFKDKDWSFTDCTSKVVMENFAITQALAFDRHFRQFGNVTVIS